MIRGLYSAASALDAQAQNHEVVAHNLAHATVPGYRRRGVVFETFDRALAAATPGREEGDILGTRVVRDYSGFETGPIAYTGNPLDLAVTGDSFFVIQGPNGPLYTRNGTFTLNGQGELQTHDGRTVLGTAGRIIVPPNTGTITVGQDGSISADGVPVGRLRLERFPDPNVLVPVGTTLFEAPPEAQPAPGTGTVNQGYREGANVQVVNEMVNLISVNRHYEASQRVLRALSEALQLNTRPQGA